MNLVPDAPGITPSYWCTWATQNFALEVCNPDGSLADPSVYEGADGARLARHNLNESLLFGETGWATRYYDAIRSDLYLVLDDGWDVPYGIHPQECIESFGSLEVAQDRFPSCTGAPQERLERLNQLVVDAGWRGTGLWLASQAAGETRDMRFGERTLEHYWRTRAQWCHQAGVAYWKVDWGLHSHDWPFRRMLSRVAREEANGLLVEHAVCMPPLNDAKGSGRFPGWEPQCSDALALACESDVFRAYDTLYQLPTATMLDRVAWLLMNVEPSPGMGGLIHCEDEVYMAASLGCVMGLMRHPAWRPRAGADYDPPRYAQRITEAIRAVRWQRLAPAWSPGRETVQCSDTVLTDAWRFEKGETWMTEIIGTTVTQSAPAIVSRGIGLPHVIPDGGEAPFVSASRHPNGAVALAALHRTRSDRRIDIPLADVLMDIGEGAHPVGIFGRFRSVTLRLSQPLGKRRVYAQDLADHQAEDITERLAIHAQTIVMDGALVDAVGGAVTPPGEASAPGLVLVLRG